MTATRDVEAEVDFFVRRGRMTVDRVVLHYARGENGHQMLAKVIAAIAGAIVASLADGERTNDE
jgi:hypothetical protein